MARTQFWNVLSAVLGGIAAFVTAVTGLYLALKGDASHSAPIADTPVAVTTVTVGTMYDRTPWMGVELRQNNQAVPLASIASSWNKFQASLTGDAFELTFTRKEDGADIGIMAWQDDSVFRVFQDENFFSGGKGIAGANFAVPILYLDKEGFNHYDTGRLKRIGKDKYSVSISALGAGDVEIPLRQYSGPLYLVIFRVPTDVDTPVARSDFELFTLKRR